jgi:subtilisin-like proprotein convertase family protein
MYRPLLLLLALLGVGVHAATSGAATKTYSTGTIAAPIPAGGTLERTLNVPDAGPVSFVRVSLRIEHPRASELSVTLVSPEGISIPLAVHRGGTGADLGEGERGCGGQLAVFEDGDAAPSSAAEAPFVDGPYRPEEPFSNLNGSEARGRWTLRVADDPGGHAGTLLCWEMDVSRDVVQTVQRERGFVRATLAYRERDFEIYDARLKIVRGGRAALDVPLGRYGCGSCPSWRPLQLYVRDLDGGEPEVIFDGYTGGAHCCVYSDVYRYDADRRAYRLTRHLWGNYGYGFADYDGDGRPELQANDERFLYQFTAYVYSAAPIQIWHYDAGRLVDVTRKFPRVVARQAADLWRTYLGERDDPDGDVRGVLAAYLADEYLLGRGPQGLKQAEAAVKRGDAGRGKMLYGTPADGSYLKALLAFLKKTGYAQT